MGLVKLYGNIQPILPSTPVNAASSNGHVEVVKLLLEKGADITVVSKYGWTPVYAASLKGHIKVIKLLLEKGADITTANNDGWTPLM
ncbi:ankyrin repeat-containing domain protein [Xylogone sp. PMI_703]|nr:ankyrin repeat-containing domain protein [Xylogone sp. PMI_703]